MELPKVHIPKSGISAFVFGLVLGFFFDKLMQYWYTQLMKPEDTAKINAMLGNLVSGDDAIEWALFFALGYFYSWEIAGGLFVGSLISSGFFK